MSIDLKSLSNINWFDVIKNYYDGGEYDNDDVAKYVYLGKITPTQYQQITNQTYLEYLDGAYKAGKIDQTYLQSCVTKGLITQAEYNVIIAS
ncbi:MAG: hypothetical protein K0R54_2119 [Clostridiaceae bacterium]|jgi:uncharacterized XkdX family phage protein|nr:hypothetical protein [Clostridiaceae bacterium]